MKKRIHICITVVLAILLLITGTYTLIHYNHNYSTEEWFRESIEDGDYLIVGNKIGNSIFDGNDEVEITIFNYINNNNSHSISFTTEIKNEGKKLTSDNYNLFCNDEYIKIQLIGSDSQPSGAYTFFFDDLQ